MIFWHAHFRKNTFFYWRHIFYCSFWPMVSWTMQRTISLPSPTVQFEHISNEGTLCPRSSQQFEMFVTVNNSRCLSLVCLIRNQCFNYYQWLRVRDGLDLFLKDKIYFKRVLHKKINISGSLECENRVPGMILHRFMCYVFPLNFKI